MILTGSEIEKQVRNGKINITPFDKGNINPNSYNYRLDYNLKIVSHSVSLGEQSSEEAEIIEIPEDGYLLQPGRVYLANTFESIGSRFYVASLIGRSSLGRLGLFLRISADLGNLGPAHKWTLELKCVQPIKVYPKMKIGQVSFWVPDGEIKEYKA